MGRKSAKSPPGSLPPRDNCLAPAVCQAASVAIRGGDQYFDNLFITIGRIEELARDLGTNGVLALCRPFFARTTVGMSTVDLDLIMHHANLNLIVVSVIAGGFVL